MTFSCGHWICTIFILRSNCLSIQVPFDPSYPLTLFGKRWGKYQFGEVCFASSKVSSTFLLKIFFQSSIMTSKMHWSIRWTVFLSYLKTMWNSRASFYGNIIEKMDASAFLYFCISYWKQWIDWKTLNFYDSWVHWKNQCRSTVRNILFCGTIMNINILLTYFLEISLTHFMKLIFFYTSWNICKRDVFWCFQEALMEGDQCHEMSQE